MTYIVLNKKLRILDENEVLLYFLQLLLPWLALEVTGFRDNKLYGYNHNNPVYFNLETRVFNNEKVLIENITKAFQTRVIEE